MGQPVNLPPSSPVFVQNMYSSFCSSNCCQTLFDILVSTFGANWRDLLFIDKNVSFDAKEFYDEILLISLTDPVGPQVKLFESLRLCTKKARLMHRFFVAWMSQSADGGGFPPADASAKIILCAETVLQARAACFHWVCFRFCPVSLLSLLCVRLGCFIAHACCSLFCYIGGDCPNLVVGAHEGFLLTTLPPKLNKYLRVVTIGTSMTIGDVPIFFFSSFQIWHCVCIRS